MKKITSLLLMCTVLHACTDKMDKEITSTAIEKINITEEAYPNHPKEIITLASGIQVDKIDSLFILGKDVILSKAQIDTLNSPLSRAAIYTDYTKHWAKGIVFYTIRPTNNPEFRQKVNAAIAHWEAKTNIRFWQVADNIKDYVEFITGDGNWSYLGRIGGSQQLSLYPDDRSSIGSAIHEIGHAIGLFHEHSRSDRDNYITINWNNIQTEYQSAFQTYVQNGYNKGEDYSYFDFSSIMLYSSQNAFANDTAIPTMTKKDGSLFKGQRTTLSNGDIAAVKHFTLMPTKTIFCISQIRHIPSC